MMEETIPTGNEELFATEKQSRFGLVGLVAFILLAAAVVWCALLWTQKAKLGGELTDAKQAIENVQESMRSIQQNENISDQLAAATILRKVEPGSVTWSKLVDRLLDLESGNTRFTGYSTNRSKQVFITGRAPNYTDVASLVDTIQEDSLLGGIFAESIIENRQSGSLSRTTRTKADTAEANEVQFQLVFHYLTNQ